MAAAAAKELPLLSFYPFSSSSLLSSSSSSSSSSVSSSAYINNNPFSLPLPITLDEELLGFSDVNTSFFQHSQLSLVPITDSFLYKRSLSGENELSVPPFPGNAKPNSPFPISFSSSSPSPSPSRSISLGSFIDSSYLNSPSCSTPMESNVIIPSKSSNTNADIGTTTATATPIHSTPSPFVPTIAPLSRKIVCNWCHQLKIRCNGTFPCDRCSKAGRESFCKKRVAEGRKKPYKKRKNERSSSDCLTLSKVERESNSHQKKVNEVDVQRIMITRVADTAEEEISSYSNENFVHRSVPLQELPKLCSSPLTLSTHIVASTHPSPPPPQFASAISSAFLTALFGMHSRRDSVYEWINSMMLESQLVYFSFLYSILNEKDLRILMHLDKDDCDDKNKHELLRNITVEHIYNTLFSSPAKLLNRNINPREYRCSPSHPINHSPSLATFNSSTSICDGRVCEKCSEGREFVQSSPILIHTKVKQFPQNVNSVDDLEDYYQKFATLCWEWEWKMSPFKNRSSTSASSTRSSISNVALICELICCVNSEFELLFGYSSFEWRSLWENGVTSIFRLFDNAECTRLITLEHQAIAIAPYNYKTFIVCRHKLGLNFTCLLTTQYKQNIQGKFEKVIRTFIPIPTQPNT